MRPIGWIGPICLIPLLAATVPAAEVTWDVIIPITTNSASQVTGRSGQHSVAVDARGDVHVVWLDQRSVPYQVWYRRYDAGTGVWLAETTLSSMQANCSQPGMSCDSAGNVHVAWQVANWNPLGVGVWAKRYNATTHHWRADTLIDSTGTSQPQQYPSVACIPGTGDMDVAWFRLPDTGMYTQVFLRERHPATGWDTTIEVSTAAVSHDQVSVAAGPNGAAVVVWVGKDLGGEYSQVFCRRRVDTLWQGTELVSGIANGLSQYSPCVACDRKGAIHVVWHGRSLLNTYQQVFHCQYDSTGWSAVESISGERAYQQQYPSIAVDAAGRCHAVWCSQTSGMHAQLTYAQRDTDGTWSSPALLTSIDSGSVNYPSIVCDGDTGVHIVWYDNHTGNPDVYYLRGSMPAGIAEPSPSSPVLRPVATATVVRGVLFLPRDMTETSEVSDRVPRPVLLDAAGRKVLTLRPGANDVRALAPGVYFVRAVSRKVSTVSCPKVVVTR